MKINQITETTTAAGSFATVATPLFKQSRKGGNLLTGKKTNKKYANSISEGRVKELQMDLSSGKDGMSDEEFKKKYGKTKQEMRALMKSKPQQDAKKVDEAKLEEDDLIIVPGVGRKLKSGFIPHDKDRTDHEVEMARSDLFQAAKNAKKVYELISNISEEVGLEGWVQEKIIKANDYLNTIREYLEHKTMSKEGKLGEVAGGTAGALLGKSVNAAMMGAELGSALQNKFSNESGAGVIAGGPQYEGVAEGLTKQAKARKEAESVMTVIKRLEAELKDPNPHLDKVDIQRRLDTEKRRLELYRDVLDEQGVAKGKITEKAVSKAQQRFMGMVHAAQKGEKPASKEVSKVAKTMGKKEAEKFASTKHKGLPAKVNENLDNIELKKYKEMLSKIYANKKQKIIAARNEFGSEIPNQILAQIEREYGNEYFKLVHSMPKAHKEYVSQKNSIMGWFDTDEKSGRSGVE
jgi:hypothetical protein